jgi:hypothetical protein
LKFGRVAFVVTANAVPICTALAERQHVAHLRR